MQWPSTRDWILLVVDKVAWGGFLVFAAFWLNSRLERWRQSTSARREWSKEEAKRIVEVLDDFGDLEAATDIYLSTIGELTEELKGQAEPRPSLEKAESARLAYEEVNPIERGIRRKVCKYRHWLGEELERKALSYLAKNRELIGEYQIVGTHDTDLMADLCGSLYGIRVDFHEAVRLRYTELRMLNGTRKAPTDGTG